MAEAKNKYTVKNTTILHNKKSYAPGATINLTDDERDKLVDYIVPVVAEEKEVTETTTTKTSKTTKKNSEKAVDNSSVTDTNDNEKKEDVNGSETIQTPAD